ncbi:tapasin-related protein-like [Puntigrus tetrazona]|uniref:tapasin-related protein-like n=1 Tax=Puntigrus tetrazona TaxID=1606681 RepID=UPI001C8A49BB|nr:tapasin-related protein-like [Puntigrus tetrazona]
MCWIFGSLFLALLCLGVNGSQSLYDLQWLPCTFMDEDVRKNEEGHIETEYITRRAVLQFGNVGDEPLHPTSVTFLVAASKVDMRRYLKGSEDELQCEIRRYSAGRIVTRWPQDHDVWFTATLHSDGLFAITTFLKHTTTATAEGQVDFLQWITIHDGDFLTTSAAMFLLTRTPSVEVGFLKEPTLHCQYGVDHDLPRVTVVWKKHGERGELFSYSSRSGKSEGSGVSVRAIAAGNVSVKLPPTNKHSEGTYVCSVTVPPLNGSHAIPLTLREEPSVSVNVGSSLSAVAGERRKLICYAERYYPLDANIEWYREAPGGGPSLLTDVTMFSHQRHKDGTYSHSAFFYLKPSVKDSGDTYTCRVSHKSLLAPIEKSVSLTVTDPGSSWWSIKSVVVITAMLFIFCYAFPRFLKERKAAKMFLLLLRSSRSSTFREKMWSV